jgi:hypothetical protein
MIADGKFQRRAAASLGPGMHDVGTFRLLSHRYSHFRTLSLLSSCIDLWVQVGLNNLSMPSFKKRALKWSKAADSDNLNVRFHWHLMSGHARRSIRIINISGMTPIAGLGSSS